MKKENINHEERESLKKILLPKGKFLLCTKLPLIDDLLNSRKNKYREYAGELGEIKLNIEKFLKDPRIIERKDELEELLIEIKKNPNQYLIDLAYQTKQKILSQLIISQLSNDQIDEIINKQKIGKEIFNDNTDVILKYDKVFNSIFTIKNDIQEIMISSLEDAKVIRAIENIISETKFTFDDVLKLIINEKGKRELEQKRHELYMKNVLLITNDDNNKIKKYLDHPEIDNEDKNLEDKNLKDFLDNLKMLGINNYEIYKYYCQKVLESVFRKAMEDIFLDTFKGIIIKKSPDKLDLLIKKLSKENIVHITYSFIKNPSDKFNFFKALTSIRSLSSYEIYELFELFMSSKIKKHPKV